MGRWSWWSKGEEVEELLRKKVDGQTTVALFFFLADSRRNGRDSVGAALAK